MSHHHDQEDLLELLCDDLERAVSRWQAIALWCFVWAMVNGGLLSWVLLRGGQA